MIARQQQIKQQEDLQSLKQVIYTNILTVSVINVKS